MISILENFRRNKYINLNLIDKLPKDLRVGITDITQKYKHNSLPRIGICHKNNLEFVKKPEDLDLIKKLKLVCVYSYTNGDSAWFSLTDDKIYDYNHETAEFNIRNTDIKLKNRLTKPKDYKIWIQDVLNEKHIDAWID